MTLTDVLNIPTYPAHLLSRDERLKELDFQKTLFLDTETTGLTGGTGTIAFMVGLGFFQEDRVSGSPVLHEGLLRRKSLAVSFQRVVWSPSSS